MSWLGHRARHAMGGLSFQHNPTGVIFGCLEQIRNVCSNPRVRSNRVALFFDGPKQSCHRRKSYRPYKDRDKKNPTPEDVADTASLYDQLAELRKVVLPACGFPCYRQIGLEADDLIADAAAGLGSENGIIVSADHDLWQCITPTVHWWDPTPGRDLYMDPERLYVEHRVSPKDWAYAKAIAGCNTDNVAGVPGVGIKTATDFIWGMLPPQSKKLQAINDSKNIIQRNRLLVELPHCKTRPVVLKEPEYDPTSFFFMAGEYGFASYAAGPRRATWEAFFRNEFEVSNSRQAVGARKRGQPAPSDGLL